MEKTSSMHFFVVGVPITRLKFLYQACNSQIRILEDEEFASLSVEMGSLVIVINYHRLSLDFSFGEVFVDLNPERYFSPFLSTIICP